MKQSIYTLLCERDLAMALITLPRILHFLSPMQQLIIVDDGSLTEGTIATLSNLSPQVKLIARKDREALILNEIGSRTNCKKYREQFPLAFKLLDIPLMALKESPRYTFTDSDIIYLKDCHQFFDQPVNTYLKTDAIKLSVKLRNGLLKYQWAIPIRFNSGYFSYDARDFDLDFVEYYLGLPDVRNEPWLTEQTCWALLFGKSAPAYCPLEDQFVCRENFEGPKEETLAIHLIGNLKGKVKDWSVDREVSARAGTPPGFEISRNVTLMDWAKKSVRRMLPVF